MNRKISITVLAMLLSACSQSKFANCVTVDSEDQFIGDWLSHQGGQQRTVETVQCEKIDGELDHSDGAKTGKVRWAVCSHGPDCGEAGMF